MSKIVGFGVLGLGHIGSKHCLHIEQAHGSQLVATADTDERKHYSSMANLKTLDQLLAVDNLDVVCICTPNGLHAQHAIAALNAGKHVVIEKPMALSAVDAEEILEVAAKNSRLVFCVMQNRYSPPSQWLKSLITNNILGDIFFVEVNCFWNRDERYYTPNHWHGSLNLDGGPLFTQFSHFIDLMYWVLGDLVVDQASFQSFNNQKYTEFEDTGSVLFSFGNNAKGAFHFSTAVYDKNLESSITIIAQNGSVKLGGQYMNEVLYCHVKDYEFTELPASNPPNHYGNYVGSAANHPFVFENVIQTLNDQAVPNTPGEDGLAVVRIIENMNLLGRRK